MKTFIKKTVLAFLLAAVFCACFSYVIDPFNVFHPLTIRDNGVEPNKNFIKMKYVLNNPDKFDSFVFGSSRVGNIHTNNIWGQNSYNMTYSEGTPKENFDNIKTMVSNGVIPKHIYVGVDNLSYTIDPDSHNTVSNKPYEKYSSDPFGFYISYLDPAVSFSSYVDIIANHSFDDSYAYRFYEFGWNSDYGNNATKYDFDHAEPSIGDAYLLDETISVISEMVRYCDDKDISLTVFTNPMYYITYDAAVEKNYLEFLKKLADVTEFCNFSGYNDISVDSANWIDSSHYSAEVSDTVLECMCFHAYYEGLYEQGFGQWVNSDNIDEFIELLNTQSAVFNQSN